MGHNNFLFSADIPRHIIPKRMPDLSENYGYEGWISTVPLPDGSARMMLNGKPFRDIQCNCWDVEPWIAESTTLFLQSLCCLITGPNLSTAWIWPNTWMMILLKHAPFIRNKFINLQKSPINWVLGLNSYQLFSIPWARFYWQWTGFGSKLLKWLYKHSQLSLLETIVLKSL